MSYAKRDTYSIFPPTYTLPYIENIYNIIKHLQIVSQVSSRLQLGLSEISSWHTH